MLDAPPLRADAPHADWLRQFRQRHGRPPTVLHIGNIAGNAYLNAKMLNAAGVDSDVICYDYYHIMGCPEWDEADYHGDLRNQFYPAWEEVDLRGFSRPMWFAQGPQLTCLAYLKARRAGRDEEARGLWRLLSWERRAACALMRHEPLPPALPAPDPLPRHCRVWRWLAGMLWPGPRPRPPQEAAAPPALPDRVRDLRQAFQEAFTERTDDLVSDDFAYIENNIPLWQDALRYYDLVVGYATDGVYPLAAGFPYLAFEHGTIRNIPFEANQLGRLCALTYRLARRSFITNADNHVAARRLGLDDFRFLPHPINETVAPAVDGATLRADLRRRLRADFLVFHPSRQHWTAERHPDWEKANDVLIEGFARFCHEVCPRAGAVFVDWGRTVEASRRLLAERGVADRVLWIEPQPHSRMLSYIQATDLVADQFFLGAFGSTTPKALMLGRPAMLYLDESRHAWCLPVLPPILNARTPVQVFEGLARLYRDPAYARDLAVAGPRWYRAYHSNEVIVETFLTAIREVVA
jgi:hypothetical protein